VSGTTVFVIDTGIATHEDLNVVGHVNYAGGQNTDCHGHCTHVAGTMGAKDDTNYVVGVAPGVALFGVKVLNCQGSGTNSGVISGMDYVAGHTAANRVANMSLGGGFSQAVNDAARNRVNNNVAVAVASPHVAGALAVYRANNLSASSTQAMSDECATPRRPLPPPDGKGRRASCARHGPRQRGVARVPKSSLHSSASPETTLRSAIQSPSGQ